MTWRPKTNILKCFHYLNSFSLIARSCCFCFYSNKYTMREFCYPHKSITQINALLYFPNLFQSLRSSYTKKWQNFVKLIWMKFTHYHFNKLTRGSLMLIDLKHIYFNENYYLIEFRSIIPFDRSITVRCKISLRWFLLFLFRFILRFIFDSTLHPQLVARSIKE